MNDTEREIFSQYAALAETYRYTLSNRNDLLQFYAKARARRVLFIGCGSSYSVAKSAAAAAGARLPLPAYALAAGDLLLHFPLYKPMLEHALLVFLSRSGSTSEVLAVAQKAQADCAAPYLSVCAVSGSPLSRLAGFSLDIPWAFDQSVCQTRCVSNLYLAGLMISAILSGDEQLLQSLETVIQNGDGFLAARRNALQAVAQRDWDQALVLAGGELAGIAEEGALAFNEICMLPSRYNHLLDVRHGPMVLVDRRTLVLASLAPGESRHQRRLLEDIKAKGAFVVAMQAGGDPPSEADHAVIVEPVPAYAALGLPFVNLCQMLSLFKALHLGVDPDHPTGLDPWIQL